MPACQIRIHFYIFMFWKGITLCHLGYSRQRVQETWVRGYVDSRRGKVGYE